MGTCVCASFPAARPAPVPWSWVTEAEAIHLRDSLHALRGAEVVDGVRSWPPVDVRAYVAAASALANLVEELLVELRLRRPRLGPAHEDVALHLGRRQSTAGRRRAMSAMAEPACTCQEPGCGIQFAYVSGLTTPERCFFCSQRKRRELLAAEGDRELLTSKEEPTE